jgi:Ca2+-binding EF-hand superfamily protein
MYASRAKSKRESLLAQLDVGGRDSVEEAARELFSQLDRDSSGFIDPSELRVLLIELGLSHDEAEDAEKRAVATGARRNSGSARGNASKLPDSFARFDVNKDNLVDFNEVSSS